MKKIFVTIRPVTHCNFKCRHCYLGDSLNKEEYLSIEAAKKFIDLLSEEFSLIKIKFFGGEPTLIGKDFYREFFKYEEELKVKKQVEFYNIISTNGFLLDEEFITLFNHYNTDIRISYDGPFNSELRPNSDIIYKKLELTKKITGKLRMNCVVTGKSINKLLDIYNWCKEKEFDLKILPLRQTGFAKENPEFLFKNDEYLENLLKVYKYWLTDISCNIDIHTFKEFLSFRNDVLYRNNNGAEGRDWLDLNADGLIYYGGHPNDANFPLGNPLMISDIGECFQSDNWFKLWNNINQLKEELCPSCKVKNTCGGYNLCLLYLENEDLNDIKESCVLAEEVFLRVLAVNNAMLKKITSDTSKYNPKVLKLLGLK